MYDIEKALISSGAMKQSCSAKGKAANDVRLEEDGHRGTQMTPWSHDPYMQRFGLPRLVRRGAAASVWEHRCVL